MAIAEAEILWDVVEEHLDESEFLVELWASSRRSCSYTLAELDRGPETRLFGHVDGLVVNGPLALERVAWPVAEDAKAEPLRLCAAALALLEGGDFRVLEVLAGANAKQAAAPGEGDDEDAEDEARRLAALKLLAERLDALETDEASKTAVQEHELGAEAWRVSAIGKLGERIEAETDDARGMELQEIEVLLRAHAPAGAVEAELEAADDDPAPALGPEELEQRRQADLNDIEEQLAATTDEDERMRLLDLQAMLRADAPDPEEAAAAAAAGEGAEAGEAAIEPEPELDPRIEPLALALALSNHPQLGDQLRSHAAKADGPTLALLLRACADRGLHPGPALDRALAHEDPAVLCAALRAATFGDRPKLLGVVEGCLQHRSVAVRAVALDTAMMWGSPVAWELALSSYKTPEAANARLWIACLGEDRHAEALVRQLGSPHARHDTLWALGFSGRVPAVIACLALLDDADELTRRLAGEAVAAIVDLDVADETLWEEPAIPKAEAGAQGEEPAADEDDLDAELAPTPESELPLPNAAAIRERWKQLASAFVPGKRYILGKPIEREGPGWALSRLSCRRVDVVAREIVARSQGVGRWPWQARSGRHMQAVGVLAELGRQAGAIQRDRR